MDESLTPSEFVNVRSRRWQPRFRIAKLLWLTAIVAAFFCGRQSDEIQTAVKRWWQVTRVRWGANVNKVEIVHWPPGSITINEIDSVPSVTVKDSSVVSAWCPAANQLCISPKAHGKTIVAYNLSAGTYQNAEVSTEVIKGRISNDWSLSKR